MTTLSYSLRAGNLADLKINTVELAAPAAGEVQIAVRAIGLNFADVFAIWGLYGATPKGEFTPGLEYSGIIEAVGEGITHLHPGDRIMGVTRFGAYTTHLNIDARYAIPMPEGWDFQTGAAYLVQTLTAYYGMATLGALQPGQTVLIHSAVGGVGLQALKIAKSYNCFTIGTVGSAEKVDFALSEGYDRVIVRDKHFEEKLKTALEGKQLHLLMDSVGGRFFSIPFAMLAPMGRAVVFGSARYATASDRAKKLHLLWHFFTRPKVDPQRMVETNRGVLGFNLIWLYENAALLRNLLVELEAMHLVPPHVGHVFPFEKLPDAVRLFQTGKTMGKVVVEVGTEKGLY
jgi:NADPH:quinone reductase-like Zn-dependent oxidoreductase